MIERYEGLLVKKLRLKDEVLFRCQRCGACCRNLKNQAMVESLDAYRIAKFLRANGRPDMEVVTVFDEYTDPMILPGDYPIFMVRTVGEDDSCVFLKDGACSIYPARLRVCRLYPFTVDTGERGRDFIWYQCMERPFHFTGGRVLVKDWAYENFSREDRAFVMREKETLPQIGRLLQSIGEDQKDAAIRQVCFLRYLAFETDEPFLEQYDRNARELLRRLRKMADCSEEGGTI